MKRPAFPSVHGTSAKVLVLGMLIGMTTCSTGGSMGTSGGTARGPGRDYISRSHIESVDGTAFNVVQQFRPRWLRVRTQGTLLNPNPAYAIIFVDALAFGPIPTLNQISTTQIDRIEFLNARDATTLYSTGYMGGII
jgi:hypothetical protein